MCRQAVRRVHEDFGNAQSFLDGLQLQPQQVAVDAVSIENLNRAGKNIYTYKTNKTNKKLVGPVHSVFT